MIIGMDMRAVLTSYGCGIGNYTVNLINTLLNECQNNQYVFLNWTERNAEEYFDIPEGVCISEVYGRDAAIADEVHKAITELNQAYKLDVFWTTIPVVKGYPVYDKIWFPDTLLVATVHDLIEYIFRDYYFLNYSAYREYVYKLYQLKDYDVLFANSECTKADFIELLGVSPERIHNIYMDGSYVNKDGDDEPEYGFMKRWGGGSFLLCVSGGAANKNARRFIKSYVKASKEYGKMPELVITGLRGQAWDAVRRIISANGMENKVTLYEHASGSELDYLYSKAEWVIVPSIYEGFGMPILEAWRHGTPVVASDNSSVGEIVGEAGVLFDPFSIDSMAEALKKVARMTDEDRERFVEAGRKRSMDFSWKNTVRSAMGVLDGSAEGLSHDINEESKSGSKIAPENDRDLFGKEVAGIKESGNIEDLWERSDNKGYRISGFLKGQGYHRIVIYGLGKWGNRLLNELMGQSVEVVCALDRRAKYLEDYIPVIYPDDKMADADAIVISPWERFGSIRDSLQGRTAIPILALDDLLLKALG